MTATAAVLWMIIFVYFLWRSFFVLVTLLATSLVVSTVAVVRCWNISVFYNIHPFFIPATLILIYITGIILLALSLKKRYSLMARLFSETVIAIFTVPSLICLPILTSLFLFGTTALFINALLLAYSNEEEVDSSYETVRLLYIIFMAFVFYWLCAFTNDCHCMIIAGTIATQYFEKDNPSRIRWALFRTIWITMRNHIGTVAAGSLVITFLRILKPLAKYGRKIKSRNSCSAAFKVCCESLNETAEYLSRKAYIMTAIHGEGLYKSGVRASRLMWLFLCDIIIIDRLAYITMYAFSVLVVIASGLIGLWMTSSLKIQYDYIPLGVGLFGAVVMTYFYVSVMNVTIETLLVCFCEDRFLNVGNRNDQYYMRPSLFNVIIEALQLGYRGYSGAASPPN